MNHDVVSHTIDLFLFVMAIVYGYLQDGQQDYKKFNDNKYYVYLFRFMLVSACFLYIGIAYMGGASSIGLKIYIFYILALMAFEDIMYTQKIILTTSFWTILVIEIFREIILIYAGFWKFL